MAGTKAASAVDTQIQTRKRCGSLQRKDSSYTRSGDLSNSYGISMRFECISSVIEMAMEPAK